MIYYHNSLAIVIVVVVFVFVFYEQLIIIVCYPLWTGWQLSCNMRAVIVIDNNDSCCQI